MLVVDLHAKQSGVNRIPDGFRWPLVFLIPIADKAAVKAPGRFFLCRLHIEPFFQFHQLG